MGVAIKPSQKVIADSFPNPNPAPGNEDDLEYYVREAGEIMGISHLLDPGKRDGKHILEFVLRQVVQFKRASQD